MDPQIVLKTAQQGEEITPLEAIVLMQDYQTYASDIHAVADTLNRKMNKDVVTYAHSKHISYTNICRYRCRFCSFHRKKRQKGSFALEIDNILEKIDEDRGLDQVSVYGGLNPELSFSYYCDMLKQIRKEFPSLHIQAFSPLEISFFVKKFKQSVTEVLKKFKECGLDSMGGYDAEILNDKVRKKICPQKIRSAGWINIIKTAHRLGIKTTATILFGHLEDEIHISEHLEIIRSIQRETGGFTEFVPIPFFQYTTPISDIARLSPKWGRIARLPEKESILRLLSVSRIFLGPSIKTIQANWFRLGLDYALKSLQVGANDLGETIFDKSAAKNLRSRNGKNGSVLSPARMKQVIRKAGKIPRLRRV